MGSKIKLEFQGQSLIVLIVCNFICVLDISDFYVICHKQNKIGQLVVVVVIAAALITVAVSVVLSSRKSVLNLSSCRDQFRSLVSPGRTSGHNCSVAAESLTFAPPWWRNSCSVRRSNSHGFDSRSGCYQAT